MSLEHLSMKSWMSISRNSNIWKYFHRSWKYVRNSLPFRDDRLQTIVPMYMPPVDGQGETATRERIRKLQVLLNRNQSWQKTPEYLQHIIIRDVIRQINSSKNEGFSECKHNSLPKPWIRGYWRQSIRNGLWWLQKQWVSGEPLRGGNA